MRWLAIVVLVAGCGRVGYDAEALDTIALVDGGFGPDSEVPTGDGGSMVDGALSMTDASIIMPVDAAQMPLAVNGNYSSAPVQYSCALGLVSVDATAFTFNDDMSTLTVTSNDPGGTPQPCAMVGASAEGTGNINVTCTLPGGCDEIYTLTGMFTDADNWSGTLTMDFVGSCLDCTTQTIPVSGSRCAGACPAMPTQ